jgi:creatinine amidohydrolase/Fe(II)-dependent formamide hydrolase-like protein
MKKKEIFLNQMTWLEIKDRLALTDIALLPAGQTEQHGHHLCIDADNIICTGLAEMVATRTYETVKPVVAPTIPFGYSDLPAFKRYPGTFTLEPATLINLYMDVAKSLIKMGFKKIIFINGHYPNPPFIEEAMRRLTKETGAFFALCNFFILAEEIAQKILSAMGKSPVWGHACLIETSVSEYFGAEIRKEKVKGFLPKPFPRELQNFIPVTTPGISIPWIEQEEVMNCIWPEESPGPQGDPLGHSKEIGEKIVDASIAPIIKLLNDVKNMEVKLKLESER